MASEEMISKSAATEIVRWTFLVIVGGYAYILLAVAAMSWFSDGLHWLNPSERQKNYWPLYEWLVWPCSFVFAITPLWVAWVLIVAGWAWIAYKEITVSKWWTRRQPLDTWRIRLWLKGLDKNGWPRRALRHLATPRPVTYAELIDETKGGLASQGMVYPSVANRDAA